MSDTPEVVPASESVTEFDGVDPKEIKQQEPRDPVIVEKEVDGKKVQVSGAPGNADDQYARVGNDEVDVIEVADGPGTYEYEKEPNE